MPSIILGEYRLDSLSRLRYRSRRMVIFSADLISTSASSQLPRCTHGCRFTTPMLSPLNSTCHCCVVQARISLAILGLNVEIEAREVQLDELRSLQRTGMMHSRQKTIATLRRTIQRTHFVACDLRVRLSLLFRGDSARGTNTIDHRRRARRESTAFASADRVRWDPSTAPAGISRTGNTRAEWRMAR